MSSSSYRYRYSETDKAEFIVSDANETGAMPIRSQKGEFKPILVQSVDEVLQAVGNPSAIYNSVFEALAFVKYSPLYIVPVIGDNAFYSGVDIKEVATTLETIGTGDNVEVTFTNTLTHFPVKTGTLVLKVDGVDQAVTESEGVITGAGVSGTLNLITGAISLTFAVAPADTLVITVDYTYWANVPFSVGRDYATSNFDTLWEKKLNENIGTGDAAIVNFTATLTNLPLLEGKLVLKVNGVDQVVSDAAGVITGATLSAGTINYATGEIDITFSTAPALGFEVTVDYVYTRDATDVLFSIYAKSQFDAQLAITTEWLQGVQYRIVVYDIISTGNLPRSEYTFSLIREKDGFNNSLYYEDVLNSNFDDIKILINADYTLEAKPENTQIAMAGGSRGDDAQASDFQTAWNFFQQKQKYRSYILMDVFGGYSSNVNDIVTTYQPHGFGVTVVPFGNIAGEAVTYRQATGIDSDQVAMYTNWSLIQDDYNNSSAWISNVGSIGGKMAEMGPVYNQESPAGYNADGRGGVLQDWTSLDIENDYSDLPNGGDLYNLDRAQVNPIIKNENGLTLIWGDKTLLNRNTDTSFIGHRRLLNLIFEVVQTQILRFKIFKNITDTNLNDIQIQSQNFLDQILADEALNGALASTSKNTQATKDQRKLILTLYIQAVTNAQFIEFQVVRVGQSTTVQQVAGQ